MSNIKLVLTENKASPYRKQRVVGRLGDGGLTTIDVELLQSDGKTPYSIFSNQNLIFVGTNSKGEYTDGVPEVVDGQNGIIRYTFTKGNFSVLKEFKRAYFQLTDADGSRVTFQDFTVDVLKNSDIDQGQVTLYVRLLDQLLSDFEKRFGDQSINFEERFKVFLQAKESQYQNIYQMYNDLVLKLDNLTKDTKTMQEMQAEILKSIEEHDVFTKQESSANVVDQVTGKKTVQTTITVGYKGKVAGSKIENPHWAGAAFSPDSLLEPSIFQQEFVQTRYDNIASLDNVVAFVTATSNGARPTMCLKIDVLEESSRLLGEQYFEDLGADTSKKKIEILDLIVSDFNVGTYGRGKGLNDGVVRNFAASKIWFDNIRWSSGTAINDTNEYKRLSFTKDPKNGVSRYLNDEGIMQLIVYGDMSDGVTNTSVNADYADLKLTFDLSANEHIKLMMAQYSGENIATQEEAEVGEDNTKTMTSLRVFQSIAQWTKNKFISLTENETVLGIKNFANGLQVGGNNVLSQKGEIIFDHTSETDSSIQSGIVRFKRYGDLVLVNFNFQCRSTNIASGGNLIGVLEADIIPSGSIQVDITYDKALTIDASGKVTALWGLDANKYYAGSTMYFAKNKL